MKAKHENIRADRLFYCFVDFGKTPNDRPIVHVLPSVLVADVLAIAHLKWLATPGKKGQPHKDGNVRRLLPDYSALLERLITHIQRVGSIRTVTLGIFSSLNRPPSRTKLNHDLAASARHPCPLGL